MKQLLSIFNSNLNANGGFLKSASILIRGTVLAQIISVISLPILTRLYSPEEYSILGIFTAIVSILSVVACLRFEIAIPIPKNQETAKALFYLACLSSTMLMLISYMILYLAYPILQDINIIKQLSIWIWLIPLGAYLASIYSAVQYWNIRQKSFQTISNTRITQSVLSNTSSIIYGAYLGGVGGLIIGQVLNFSGGIFKLGKRALYDFKKIKHTNLKSTFFLYKKFPVFSTIEALANTSALQLPIIIIGVFLIGPEVGFLMLSMRILGIPMGLIGTSLSQVYLANAPEQNRRGYLYKYTLQIILKISKLAAIPFILLFVFSPFIFKHILGEEWGKVGIYIMFMTPWYFAQILSSPVSMSLHIINKQNVALFLQVFGFLLRVIGLFLIAIYNPNLILSYYITSALVFYIIYIVTILTCLKFHSNNSQSY